MHALKRGLILPAAVFGLWLVYAGSSSALAASFALSPGKCTYTGHLDRVYVSRSSPATSRSIMLVYTKISMDLNLAASNQPTDATKDFAIRVNDPTSPGFAKFFHATALSARLAGKEVSIMMNEVGGGYLVADRI